MLCCSSVFDGGICPIAGQWGSAVYLVGRERERSCDENLFCAGFTGGCDRRIIQFSDVVPSCISYHPVML